MVIKTFAKAKEYLESRIPVGVPDSNIYGLERIRLLLEVMRNPQDAYPTVHVGGTAGKGSTCTVLSHILNCAGYRVGLHVSPHIQDIREREQVNGRLVSEDKFVKLTNYVKQCSEEVANNSGYGMPTYFEMLVAMSFQHFKDEKVDIAVIEVGLGGRLDGTNVINPKVAIITNVGLDHMEILGNTVESIASEKTGIIKEGIDVVSGVSAPSVVRIVKNRAKTMHCRLDLLYKDISYTIREHSTGRSVFDINVRGINFEKLDTGLLGEHQMQNIALAVDAALMLGEHGFVIKEQDIRTAIRTSAVPGRFETLAYSPRIILDGAHNQMKAHALVSTLKEYCKGMHIRVVFAAKKDKRAGEIISELSEITDKFYFTQFGVATDFGKRMAYSPQSLAAFATSDFEVFDKPGRALERAIQESGKSDVICITGSLYLVGELRSYMLEKKRNFEVTFNRRIDSSK